MELAPYVLYSSVAAFLGGISYNYIKTDSKDYENEIDIEYDNCDKVLKKNLGIGFKDKSENIIKIYEEECGKKIHNTNSSKTRMRLLRYIREYERFGHDSFVKSHSKV